MVISIKDYTWRQTDHNIIIRIPIKKGITNSKIDIFTSEKYIKAFFNPFIFEVFLLHSINESASSCTFTDDEIIFELEKLEEQTWETLENTNINKEGKMLIKQQVIEETQKLLQSKQETKIKLKSELSRVAVRKQMALDSERIENIKQCKDTIKSAVMAELDEWKEEKKQLNYDVLNEEDEEVIPKNLKVSKKEISKKLEIPKKSEALPVPTLLPRKTSTIDITFSERVFPTPKRESQDAEEQEWLRKQTEARRIAGWTPSDLRPEEIDPNFLKTKGDTFFKQKNYLGAVSAYGYGITLNPKYAALYVNRSAAHFALGNLHKCIEDCSQALELLTPPVSANLESRAKCYARRGAAFCKLGLASKGVIELEAAVKLMPNNENLKNDLAKARVDAEKEKRDDGSK
ncbi:dynein axonemal assembly factor 4-like [Chrysoperla carnea]|uniref:dynein axonemal assembly factor 4-like n=1 Tax=Chrysoperla carnea TaxID=189513 RepID=UPI001D07B116|nr:dynein axonemal assembly factor 4-like [Chrysoperla carnea]